MLRIHVSVRTEGPRAVGKQDEKKGNEGQTENIRIIEISGKIFCVATCQWAEVMTLAYALPSDKHQTLPVRMGSITSPTLPELLKGRAEYF